MAWMLLVMIMIVVLLVRLLVYNSLSCFIAKATSEDDRIV